MAAKEHHEAACRNLQFVDSIRVLNRLHKCPPDMGAMSSSSENVTNFSLQGVTCGVTFVAQNNAE